MEMLPMFCNQCQEASHGHGCDRMGVCGKTPETAAELYAASLIAIDRVFLHERTGSVALASLRQRGLPVRVRREIPASYP